MSGYKRDGAWYEFNNGRLIHKEMVCGDGIFQSAEISFVSPHKAPPMPCYWSMNVNIGSQSASGRWPGAHFHAMLFTDDKKEAKRLADKALTAAIFITEALTFDA